MTVEASWRNWCLYGRMNRPEFSLSAMWGHSKKAVCKPGKRRASPGFPGGTSGKEPACQCRRHRRCRFDPWVRKIPWSKNGNPLQYSCLENLMDRWAWQVTVHGVTKELDLTEANQSPIMLVPWSQPSQSSELGEINFCRLNYPIYGILLIAAWTEQNTFQKKKKHKKNLPLFGFHFLQKWFYYPFKLLLCPPYSFTTRL